MKEKEPILAINMIPDSPKSQARIDELTTICRIPTTAEIPYDPELIFDNDIERAAANCPFRDGLEKIVDELLREP